MHQKILGLEKQWVTRDDYFRIFTAIAGICVVDTWSAYKHPINHHHKTIELMLLVNMLTQDFLENKKSQYTEEDSETVVVINERDFDNSMPACILTES